MNLPTKQKQTTDIENKLTVTKGERGEGGRVEGQVDRRASGD